MEVPIQNIQNVTINIAIRWSNIKEVNEFISNIKKNYRVIANFNDRGEDSFFTLTGNRPAIKDVIRDYWFHNNSSLYWDDVLSENDMAVMHLIPKHGFRLNKSASET